MEKVAVTKSAQVVFIFIGTMLIIANLVEAYSTFQASAMLINVVNVFCGVTFSLYIFYIGIMAAITGSYPHEGAKIVFKVSRIVGVRARIRGCCLVVGSLLIPLMAMESYETSSELEYELKRTKKILDRYEVLLKEKTEELTRPEGL